MRNPNWTKDELILALELYFRDETAIGNKTHIEVIKLSRLLNSLPIFPNSSQELNFRNPNGVAMKLVNFRRFDPKYKGKGLQRGNKIEKLLWDKYASNLDELIKIKNAIINSSNFLKKNNSNEIGVYEYEAFEGRLLTRVHSIRERNQGIIEKKKQFVMREKGALKCEVCSFDFKETYGEYGLGFAECHHIIPVSQLTSNAKTRLDDLAILCANCHRMIHYKKPWKTVGELKQMIEKNNYLTKLDESKYLVN